MKRKAGFCKWFGCNTIADGFINGTFPEIRLAGEIGSFARILGKFGGCHCFTAGTKVLTDEGEKNIEDIEVGDKVLPRMKKLER